MYRDWPFFRCVFDNVQLGLGKSCLEIAQLYSELTPAEIRTPIFADLQEEFARSEKAVLEITDQQQLLEREPWLERSIRVRNPYVDPLNYIQAALLGRLRQAVDDAAPAEEIQQLTEAIRLSVNGIAAGVKNVG